MHYEESPDQFPLEFGLLFGGAFNKATQSQGSGTKILPLMAHYRTRSGNHDPNRQSLDGYTGQNTLDDHVNMSEADQIVPVTQQNLRTDQNSVNADDLNDQVSDHLQAA